jgi:hypothetical protein
MNRKPAPPKLAHDVVIELADETCRRCGIPAYRTRRGWRHEHREK